MTDKNKKKTGRPERYPGEKQQRLSVMMRPRYKKALEMVAKHRQTTLTEAAELAVALLSRDYEFGNGGVRLSNYVFSAREFEIEYFKATGIGNGFEFEEEASLSRIAEFDNAINELDTQPYDLLTEFDKDYKSILKLFANPTPYFKVCFIEKEFRYAFKEYWKTVPKPMSAMWHIRNIMYAAAGVNLAKLNNNHKKEKIFAPPFEMVYLTKSLYHDVTSLLLKCDYDFDTLKNITEFFKIVDDESTQYTFSFYDVYSPIPTDDI